MMHVRLARQQRVDHVSPEPVAERIVVAARHHRDAARRHRLQAVGRRQAHQHLAGADRRRAFDAEAVAVEQPRQIVEAQVIGKAGALAAEIGGAIAQHHVLLGKAQMREQVFDVGHLLERAEHDDDVGLRRGLGREIAAGDTGLIAAAVRQQTLERRGGAEIEHARAGGNELRGEFGPRIPEREPDRLAGGFVGRGIEEFTFDVGVHVAVPGSQTAVPSTKRRITVTFRANRWSAMVNKSLMSVNARNPALPARACRRAAPERLSLPARSRRQFRPRRRTTSPGRSPPRISNPAICAGSD